MKQFEARVYIETLTIWAKDEEEAEAQYAAFYGSGECILHKTSFLQCHCIERAEEVGHTMEELID
jgi:hypothetical protein